MNEVMNRVLTITMEDAPAIESNYIGIAIVVVVVITVFFVLKMLKRKV